MAERIWHLNYFVMENYMFYSKRKIDALAQPPVDDVRRRTRILVIDDDENSFPIQILRQEGYTIDYWDKVNNLHQLEEGDYDIIILDIQGVAKELDREDGLGILKHIKEVNPSQIVVAFSGHSYDLSKAEFWKIADDSLAKPVDATKCKRLIDNLIENKRTPIHYWKAVSARLLPFFEASRCCTEVVEQGLS
jgi:DNA-binding NtrC family response regulator